MRYLLIVLVLMVASCATVDHRAKLPVQYATAKLIAHSSEVTAERVLVHVERVRRVAELDAVIDTAQIINSFTGVRERLDPADRLLLDALLLQIEHFVIELPVTDQQATVLMVLNWVEDAARLYQ